MTTQAHTPTPPAAPAAAAAPVAASASSVDDPREVLVPGELYAALAVAAAEAPDWHRDALCAQADPEAFFPEKGGSPREAKQVCRRCPVREQCLTDAIAHDERFGVWGGIGTRQQRQTLAPTLAPAPEAESESESVTVEQSQDRGSGAPRRESTPVPRGRAAVDGMAARLPTEPRPVRVLRQGPRSTFPDRARRTPATTTAAARTATTTTATAGPDGPAGPVARAAGVRAAAGSPDRLVPAPRDPSPARRRDQAATAGAATATVTVLRSGRPDVPSSELGPGEEPVDDLAAPAPAAAARPPDPLASAGPPAPPSGELAATITAVLTAQRRIAGGPAQHSIDGDPAEADVDPVQVLALVTGERDTPTDEAELRVAAVVLVESGRATRGQTARRFGVRSQDVAHWVACHQQGIRPRATCIRGPR